MSDPIVHALPHSVTVPDDRPGVIYAMVDPRDNRVRYVGKAGDLKARRRQHTHDLLTRRCRNPHLQHWFDQLGQEGYKPRFEVLQECTPGTLDACEREWIERGKAKGWNLCNIAPAGHGRGLAEDTRRKLSEHGRAKWSDPAYVARWEQSQAKRWGVTVEEFKARREAKRLLRAERVQGPRQPSKERAERRRRAETAELMRTLTPLTCRGVAFVPLTHGAYAMVDAGDWQRVARHRWSLQVKGEDRRAKRTVKVDGKHSGLELLNRFVMQAKPGQMVTHDDGDQLNCTRANLTVIEQATGQPAALLRWEQRMASYVRCSRTSARRETAST